MSFKSKRVKVKGLEVDVRCERIVDESSPAHRVCFTAEIDGTKYHHTHTIGPEDGPIPQVSLEQVQKDINAARKYAAEHAHLHHSIKKIIADVD
jgi:hypothetical protein